MLDRCFEASVRRVKIKCFTREENKAAAVCIVFQTVTLRSKLRSVVQVKLCEA